MTTLETRKIKDLEHSINDLTISVDRMVDVLQEKLKKIDERIDQLERNTARMEIAS